jgi:hypothetical protein
VLFNSETRVYVKPRLPATSKFRSTAKDQLASGVNTHVGLFLVAIRWDEEPFRGVEHERRIIADC